MTVFNIQQVQEVKYHPSGVVWPASSKEDVTHVSQSINEYIQVIGSTSPVELLKVVDELNIVHPVLRSATMVTCSCLLYVCCISAHEVMVFSTRFNVLQKCG